MKKTIRNHVREVLGEGPLLERALKPRRFTDSARSVPGYHGQQDVDQ